MKLLIAAFIAFGATSAFADSPEGLQTTYINTCTYYQYNSSIGGYTCQSHRQVEVADRYDIQSLENEIALLKARVRRLEAEGN